MHKITLTLPTEGGTRSSYNCRFIDYFLLDLAAADSDSLHPLSRIVPASSELPQCACCIRHITGAAVADFPCIYFRMGCKYEHEFVHVCFVRRSSESDCVLWRLTPMAIPFVSTGVRTRHSENKQHTQKKIQKYATHPTSRLD